MKKLLTLLIFLLTACDNPTQPKEELKVVLTYSCYKLNCVFSATGSTPYNSITQFRMDFGDGDVTYQNPIARHIYNKSGEYIVSVIIVNRDGELKETYKRIVLGE